VAGRIVLFGATGYTGRLAAEAMVERGLKPVLAARSQDKLDALAAELGGELETARADVSDPPSVRALVEEGDVLVTTVGPFARWGAPAAAAATTAGAHYIDSTGEPAFIREVFERYGPVAERAGIGMITAFGYDWVPGNLAGALALERAGELATRIDVGYFLTGSGGSMSGGTKASTVGAIASPSFAFRDGRVQTERGAKRVRSFPVRSKQLQAISVGSSEHFGLPRAAPRLREVNAYLGWFGPASRAMQVMSAGTSLAMKVPGVEQLWSAAGERFVKGSTGGPDETARSKIGSHIVGMAYDAGGRQLSEVHLTGIDGYTFTGRMLAWGADRVAAGALKGTGALGPVDAFGLEELAAGCAEAGIAEEGGGPGGAGDAAARSARGSEAGATAG
jgi:short subunit dehydrogenase-like uncharacterized protein